MKFSPTMLIVAVMVVVIAALVLTRPDGADVALARRQTQQAIAQATQVLAQNPTLKQQADSARRAAAAHEQKAQQANIQLAVAKSVLFKAALAAPDTCGPVVLAAQKALASADSVIDQRTAALVDMTLSDLKDSARADKAEAALVALRAPAQALVETTNTGFLARLKRLRPEMSAGVMGGIDITGKPNAVVGVGFTVHF